MVIKQQCDGNQRQVSSTFPGFTFGRLPDNFRNSMTYEELVHMAMMAGNLTNFETILFGPHTFVHLNLGCLMEHQETATYDPLFLFHHAYVDKVFADWQAAHPHVQPPPGDFMLPFNLTANEFRNTTNIRSDESWQFKENLCYDYEESLDSKAMIQDKKTFIQSSRAVTDYVFNSYAAVIVPINFGGTLDYKHCNFENVCSKEAFAVFGPFGVPVDSRGIPVNKENFFLYKQPFAFQENFPLSRSAANTKTPREVQWTSLSVSGPLKINTPAPPLMAFQISNRKSGASRTFLHLPLNVSKEQYGNVLDDHDVREHCDRFQIVDSDLVTSGAGALIDWQLGDPKSCSKK